MVKNLFFNVPARRKFLKSNTTELKHIINEIQRVAIPNPEIKISFYHNQSALYELIKTNYRKRIVDVFGKSINQSLVPVEEETSLVKIIRFYRAAKICTENNGRAVFLCK